MGTIRHNALYAGFIPVLVLILTWSFLGGWITLFSRQWIWVLFGSILVVGHATSFLKSKQIGYLAIYSVVLIANLLAGDSCFDSPIKIIYEITLLFFCSGLCYLLLDDKIRGGIAKSILWIGAFVVIFTAIGTFIADRNMPGIVRMLVVYTNHGVSCVPYYRIGVCEYTMPHAIPILIPPLVMWIKNRSIKGNIRLLSLIVLIFILLLIYISGTTTPLLVALLALSCSLLVNRKKSLSTNIIRIIVVAALLLPVLNKDVQLSIIHGLESVIPEDNSNYNKLVDFENLIMFDETTGDVEERRGLYDASLSSFFDNILIGGSKTASLGGHSILLDRLGSLGLVGTIPYLVFIWLLAKSVYKRLPDENKVYYVIGVICFLLMLALKNMDGTWMWITMCVFLPVMMLPYYSYGRRLNKM